MKSRGRSGESQIAKSEKMKDIAMQTKAVLVSLAAALALGATARSPCAKVWRFVRMRSTNRV